MATLSETMTAFRKSLVGVEEARVAAAAIIKAAGTSESVAATMQPLILSQLESLQTAMRVGNEALAAVVQAAQPAKAEEKKKAA